MGYHRGVMLAWPPLVSVLIALAPSSVEVRGATACPTPVEVSLRMALLITPEASLPASDSVELRNVASARAGVQDVEVRLVRAGVEQPLGLRRIQRDASCSDMADAVAVVAATWIGHYPTTPLALPTLPDAVLDLPPPLPIVAAISPSAAAAPTLVTRASAASPLSPPGSEGWPAGSGMGAAGGVVASTRGGAAPQVQVEGEARPGSRWRLPDSLVVRLTGAAATSRTVALSAGQVGWQRFVLLPTLGYSRRGTHIFGELGGGPAAALLRAQGQAFASNDSDTSLDLGAAATLRLGAALAAGAANGLVLHLKGELGAGKTSLARGLIQGLGHAGRVKSPTYTLLESIKIKVIQV